MSALEVAAGRRAAPRLLRRPALTMLLAIGIGIVALLLAAFVWRYGPWAAPSFVEYRMPVSGDIPAALAVAPDGSVWFTIENSNALGVLRGGRLERVARGRDSLEPLGLAVGAAGDVWFTDALSNSIGQLAANGTVTWFPVPTRITQFGRLAVAPDASVWFADSWSNAVVRLQDGRFTAYQASIGSALPYGVAVADDGTVWATLQAANQLVRIGVDGQTAELELPTRQAGPSDVAVDRSGAVWFLELRAGKLGRYAAGRFEEFSIPGPQAGLTSLAIAPDGAVWLSALREHKLIRFRDGRFTDFELPRASARPLGMAADELGNVWYTDLGGWLGSVRAEEAQAAGIHPRAWLPRAWFAR